MNVDKEKKNILDSLSAEELSILLRSNTARLFSLLSTYSVDTNEILKVKKVQQDLIKSTESLDKNILVNSVINGLCDSASNNNAFNYIWNPNLDFNVNNLRHLFDDNVIKEQSILIKEMVSEDIEDRVKVLKDQLINLKDGDELLDGITDPKEVKVTHELICALQQYQQFKNY